MGLSGRVGAGAAAGLEALLTRQLEEAQIAETIRARKATEGMQRDRLSLDRDVFGANEAERVRVNDDRDAARRETANRAGVADMERQAKLMADQAAAAQLEELLKSLSPPQQTVVRLGGKLSMSDMKTPEDLAAEGQAKVAQVGAEAEARAKAEAKYREPKEPKAASGGLAPAGGDKTAGEIVRLATALRDHPSRKNVFGVMDSRMPTLRQGTADAETLLNSLKAMLTLENTDKMKGVLSDSDMRLLQQASSSLANNMSDPAAEAELNRLIEVMGRASNSGVAPAPAPSHEAPADSPYAAYLRRRGGR